MNVRDLCGGVQWSGKVYELLLFHMFLFLSFSEKIQEAPELNPPDEFLACLGLKPFCT